jgi:NAD+ kinase
MKVAVTANPRKPVALELAGRAVAHIGDRAEIVLSTEVPTVAPERPHVALEAIRADAIVAIGGDGTFLYTLRRTELPLLPVNAGTLGVLAEVGARGASEFEGALDRLLEGRYFLEERLKLAGEVDGTPMGDVTNEFVIHAAEVGKMSEFELAFDHNTVGRLRADGLIVATPTGSTAYSLSSLGPIVDPALDAIVLTAIAPFRVQARAVVVEPLHTVRLRAVEVGKGAVAIADGQEEYPVAAGAAVTIYRSPRRATLVRFGSRLFERLRGKRILPWAERSDEATDAVLPTGA